MNAGFSNLDFLKKQILAGTVKDPRFDAVLLALGQGVAAQFESFCGRKFQRAAGQVDAFGADRCQFLLARYPVEPPVALVEYKEDEPSGWVVQNPADPDAVVIQSLDAAAGIVYLPDGADAGEYYSQVRFTYTGGYFWETLEPDDAAFPSALPAGAAALPADLLAIWILQCKHIWAMLDKIGTDLLKDGSAKSLRFPEEFAPTVEKTLAKYLRYNLT